jgi:hypothetical protein
VSKAQLPESNIRWSMIDDDNVEARNVIIRHVGVPGAYSIDALTEQGDWLRLCALEFAEEYRDDLARIMIEHFRGSWKHWRNPRATAIVGFRLGESDVVPNAILTLQAPSDRRIEAIENLRNDWVLSPEEILSRLESATTSVEDRITAVLFAETLGFNETHKPRLLCALFKFAIDNRFSRNDEMTTAVGSAIRKFAMNMPESSFEDYSELLVPTDTNTLSCEIELELAKAVGWRLIKTKRTKSGKYPNLEGRLSELASDYLTPRLILQENYASIVIHAVISVGLLNGSRQNELIDRIAMLHMDWFSDLFARRLLEVTRKRQATTSTSVGNLARLHKRLIAAKQ